jgi:predicted ArsR family transcriptional regulator
VRDDDAEGGSIVKDMTVQDLAEHLELLQQASQEDLDELLHDLLVRVYPTKKTQDS